MAGRAIVIPARYASTRLPGKPLLDQTGRPLIQHVYEQALRAEGFDAVIVATDDERIQQAVTAFGGRAVMTRQDHPSGTDRVAEVAAALEVGILVNLQGDEPEIDPAHLTLVADLLADGHHRMATLVCPLSDPTELDNPAVVKVTLTSERQALYFSRAAIPYQRDSGAVPARYKHIGLYAYTREALARWPQLDPTPLEQAESLEQLRALENGWAIRCAVVDDSAPGIDTPSDYRGFVDRWRRETSRTH